MVTRPVPGTTNMSVIFLFIDGVGLGREDASNPFHNRPFRGFTAAGGDQPLTRRAGTVNDEGHLFKPVDACLDVDGLPQSGTGQTALFTGENAAQIIGRHFGPYPHSRIRHLLEEESLFIKARQMGKSCHFINAYPDIFFRKAARRDRWSCTTLMTRSAGIRLNRTEDVKRGQAVTAEITQKAWRDHLDIDVPVISEEEAAERLLQKSEALDLVLHEYYLSDKAGHSRDKDRAEEVLAVYDRFLWELIDKKGPGTTIVLSSDHGNIEDLSIKTHTRNRVPLAVIGPGAGTFAGAESILDVTPAILGALDY